MIKKVLVAVDGSENAMKATEFGADIAAKYDAKMVLVHVLLRNELSESLRHLAEVEHLTAEGGQSLIKAMASVPLARFPGDIVFSDESAKTPENVLRSVGKFILGQAETLAREHGVSAVTKRMEDGDTVNRILEIIKAEDVDLLFTGARGLSDLKALLVGSVSHKLSHLSPVTCITVR